MKIEVFVDFALLLQNLIMELLLAVILVCPAVAASFSLGAVLVLFRPRFVISCVVFPPLAGYAVCRSYRCSFGVSFGLVWG
jgi:uncharacterized membrane protein